MVSDTEGQWLVILRQCVCVLVCDTEGQWCEGQWLVILRDNG